MDNSSIPLAEGEPHPFGSGNRPMVQGLLSPANHQSFAWDFAIAKARGIYGFDALDARSRSFNMVRAQLMELNAQRGWRLFGVVSATPNVGKSFIAANIAAALSREPTRHAYAIDLDLRRATLSAMFGVVSATPNVGKSFIAANIAAALSREPTRHAYAIDLDLRRATLSAMFGISPRISLSSYLGEEHGAHAPSAYLLDNEDLTVVATTAMALRSAELVAGPRASALLQELRDLGDNSLVIVDLPPVFANDDALTVMSKLDAYIMVAEEGKTRQRELQDSIGLLGPERLAGVILNKYRGGMISEGYGFDSYYADGYATTDGES